MPAVGPTALSLAGKTDRHHRRIDALYHGQVHEREWHFRRWRRRADQPAAAPVLLPALPPIDKNSSHFFNGQFSGLNELGFADGHVESHNYSQIRFQYAGDGGDICYFY